MQYSENGYKNKVDWPTKKKVKLKKKKRKEKKGQ